MSGTIITTMSSLGLTLSGTSQPAITIAATGSLEPPSGPAIYAAVPHWRLFNQGNIISGGASGIYLQSGTAYLANQGYVGGLTGIQGYITLQNTGQVTGRTGAGIAGMGNIVNRGTISGTWHGASGVVFSSGTIVNGRVGQVRGAYQGVRISGAGSITNLGTIEGGQGAGVVLGAGVLMNGASTVQTARIYGHSGGVSLTAGGTIFNYGQISGFNGIYAATGTVENTGLVSGGASLKLAIPFAGYTYASGAGVILADGTLRNGGTVLGGGIPAFPGVAAGTAGTGAVLNAGFIINTGSIAGGVATGAALTGGNGVTANAGTLDNNGEIAGGAAYKGGNGVMLLSTAYAQNSGTIQGGSGTFGGAGAWLQGGTLVNSGSLSGGTGTSWSWSPGLAAGAVIYTGLLMNAGNITGGAQQHIGADLGAGTLSNAGTISGATGILEQSGLIANTGLIQASAVGVELWNGVLTNAGTVSGPYAVYMGAAARTLVADPGASFQGKVAAHGGATLNLAGGTGMLDMGTSFSGFGAITFSPAGHWTLAGGLPQLTGGEVITGFTQGDTLELEDFTASAAAYVPGVGMELSNGTSIVTISIATSGLIVTPNALGTRIAICYVQGTRITTAQGERAIEELAIGDVLPTHFGCMQRIKWIGRQSFTAAALQGARARAPIRIMANALDPNMPKRDLFISPGHSILLNGRLILAKHLLNGLTITQPEPVRDVTYHLIEFATHDCILAEGVWAESFADGPGLRANFDNQADFYKLYPGHTEPETVKLCAPRPEQGPELAVVLRAVAARAGYFHPGALRGFIEHIEGRHVEGWAQDAAWPDLPQILQVWADGEVLGEAFACQYREDLAAAGISQGRAHFIFTADRDFSSNSLRVCRLTDGAALPRLF